MPRPRPLRHAFAAAALALAIVAAGAAVPSSAVADPQLPPPAADIFPNVGTADFDVEHYEVEMDYRGNDDISAVTTVTATAAGALATIRLDLEGMTVDAVTVNGEDASFTREDDAPATRHKLVIVPSAPVSGEFTVEVTYHGAPGRHEDPDGSYEGWIPTDAGVVALGQPVGTMTWLPSNNTVGDKATYDIEVTAPTRTEGQDLAVASSGNLVGRTAVDADRTRWSWDIATPLSTSMLVLAIGHLDVVESTVTLASGRTLSEWSFIDAGLDADTRANVDRMRGRIAPMLDWLETKLGPYPGESVGLIYDRAGVGYALETQDRPFFDGWIDESVLLHELTHMWLGNSVSPRTWSEIWLSEGGATFFESYYAYDVLGEGDDPRRIAFDAVANEKPEQWQTPSVGWTDAADLYGWQSYTRGSYVYSALMNALGPDGFDEVLTAWATVHRTSTVVTADFITLASEVSGRDLGRTLDQWILGDTAPLVPEDIVSIASSGTVETTAGTVPVLPATVTPVYASGPGTPSPVTWDTSAVDWATPGTIAVAGAGTDFFGAPFTTASVNIVITAGPSPTASPTSSASPVPTVSPTPAATSTAAGAPHLAATGAASSVMPVVVGAGLLVVGVLAFVLSRRRRRAD